MKKAKSVIENIILSHWTGLILFGIFWIVCMMEVVSKDTDPNSALIGIVGIIVVLHFILRLILGSFKK